MGTGTGVVGLSTGGNLFVGLNGALTEKFIVENDGDVRITKLKDLNDSNFFDFAGTCTGNVHITDIDDDGLITCSTDDPSDARLKTNVQPLTNVLERLEQVRGVSFEWNDTMHALGQGDEGKHLGMIAQEVEAVFPELVSTWGDEDYKAVEYGHMTAVLVEAVKELNAENKDLRARLEALEQAAGIDGNAAEPMTSGSLFNPWMLFSGLAMGGLVLGGVVTVRRSRRGNQG